MRTKEEGSRRQQNRLTQHVQSGVGEYFLFAATFFSQSDKFCFLYSIHSSWVETEDNKQETEKKTHKREGKRGVLLLCGFRLLLLNILTFWGKKPLFPISFSVLLFSKSSHRNLICRDLIGKLASFPTHRMYDTCVFLQFWDGSEF